MAGKPGQGIGHKKNGGRRPGTPNVDTAALCAILEKAGYCPVANLIKVSEAAWKEYERADEIFDAIQDKRVDNKLIPLTESLAPAYLKIVQSSAADLMPYIYPRRKAIELTGENGADLFQSFAAVMKQAADKFDKDKAIEAQVVETPNADA